MACTKCQADGVILIRYGGQELCEHHFLRFFDRRAKAQLAQQGRLPEGKIAVALSGGKDSVAMLHWMQNITSNHPRISLVAVTVDEGIAGYRDSAIEICREVTAAWGIPWTMVRTEELAGYTIDAYAADAAGPGSGATASTARDRPACGACGVFRRHGINEAAKAAGADAVVTGHNLDDMAQTVLMNHVKGDVDRLARLAPHTGNGALIPRLVPFRTIPEKEVLLYAYLHKLPIHDEASCPYAERSHRFEMRDILIGLEERHPGTRHALVRGADRIRQLLPSEGRLGMCTTCGGPSSGAVCKVCYYRELREG